MLKNYCFLICLCLAFTSYSQITSNSSVIIDTDPNQDDFSDLEPLKELWKDKRIILLGEQSHREGSVFKEKVRLIKFLHSEMGFDMVAFESGIYDNYKAFKEIKNGAETKNSPLYSSVFPIWSYTDAFVPLVDYVHKNKDTEHQLEVAGFDFLGNNEIFWSDLKNEITLSDKELAKIEEVMLGDAAVLADHPEDTASFYLVGEKIITQLADKQMKTNHQKMVEQSFKSWLGNIRFGIDAMNEKKIFVQNPRDEWMAKNLIFLSELYPDKKIIAWGASYHFANEVTNFKNTEITKSFIKEMHENENPRHPEKVELFNLDEALDRAIAMGKYLKKHFGDQLYSLAFSSYQGSYGMVLDASDHYPLVTPPDGSIEAEMASRGKENSIIDYVSEQSKSKWFYSSALGNLPIYAQWRTIFDGLYFMKSLEPASPRKFEDQQKSLSEIGQSKKGDNIYGRVLDANSKESIPYVNISLMGASKGVSSNSVGDFMFNFSNNGSLIFSCIGYETDTVVLSQLKSKNNLNVYLKPKTYLLSEVVITDKPLIAKDIVKKARKAIDDNYLKEPLNQEVYYKVSEMKNDSIYFNEESSIMLYYENGFTTKSKLYGNILQYRDTLKKPAKGWHGVGSLWLMHAHDVIMDKGNVLFRTGAYNLEIKEILEFEGRKVYNIFFECKRPSAYTTGFGYPAPESASG
ncbi:MAG: erythromycin esterase family protein, partial [Fulvivirga sp.]